MHYVQERIEYQADPLVYYTPVNYKSIPEIYLPYIDIVKRKSHFNGIDFNPNYVSFTTVDFQKSNFYTHGLRITAPDNIFELICQGISESDFLNFDPEKVYELVYYDLEYVCNEIDNPCKLQQFFNHCISFAKVIENEKYKKKFLQLASLIEVKIKNQQHEYSPSR